MTQQPSKQSDLTAGVVGNIRRMRDARGWSVRQVAERCATAGKPEMNRSVLANLENGRRPYVTLDELDALANVFSVPASALLAEPARDAFCGQDIIDEQFALIEDISDHVRVVVDDPTSDRTRDALRRLIDAMDRLRTIRTTGMPAADPSGKDSP